MSLNYSLHQWTFLFTLSHLFEGQSFQITILIHTVLSRTDSGTTPRVLRTQGPSEWLSKYVSTVHLITIIVLSSFTHIQWHSYTGYMINETMRNKELVGVVIDLSLFRSWGAHSVVPCCSSVPIELQAVNSDIRYWPLDRQWHWLIELQRGCCDNN